MDSTERPDAYGVFKTVGSFPLRRTRRSVRGTPRHDAKLVLRGVGSDESDSINRHYRREAAAILRM